MSDLSDVLEELIQAENQRPDTQTSGLSATRSGITVSTADPLIDATPGFEEMKRFYDTEITRVIRRNFRFHAGEEAFADPLAAYNATADGVHERAIPMAIQALSDGIQMGQGSSFSFKKYKMFNKFDEAFSADGWRAESALIALSFEADPDVIRLLQDYVRLGGMHMCAVSGYAQGMYPTEKIWDIWDLALTSICIGMYVIGHRLGAKWQEETVLNGILSATEEGGES